MVPGGLGVLPLHDVTIPRILPLLHPRDWCSLRATDRAHRELVAAFLANHHRLLLPYCKALTEPSFLLLTSSSTCLRTLHLPGCKLLTCSLLRPLLARSPHLRSLDLSECHHLTASILQTVSVVCSRLSRLILRDCHWVTRDSLQYHCTQQGRSPGQARPPLPSLHRVGASAPAPPALANYPLQEVDLTGCWELDDATITLLLISFPRLTCLRLGNIYSLTNLTMRAIATHATNLHTLDIRGCWRITDAGVGLVAEYCPLLASLAVTDCRDVTEASLARLRARGVEVDRKLDPTMARLARIRRENRQARLMI